jgi:hypothetical protein
VVGEVGGEGIAVLVELHALVEHLRDRLRDPPCSCPSASNGLMMVPASSTATSCTTRVRPVSVSTVTTARCAPNGNVIVPMNIDDSLSAPSSAARVIAGHSTVRAGVPITWKHPRSRSKTVSSTTTSRRSAATLRPRSITASHAWWIAEPAS